jgi:hypothetical protein
MSVEADRPKPTKDDKGRFVTGNIGGGRPKGSRNKLAEAFTQALHDDFLEHGEIVIATVRAEKPDQYLKVIASLVPKDVNLNVNNLDDLSDAELAERIQSLATTLAPFLAGGTGNADQSAEGPQGEGQPARVH